MSVTKVYWSTLLVLALIPVIDGGAQQADTPPESLVAMGIVGYADRLSVQPGETIRFMVSSQLAEYQAAIVRLIHGDPNPRGPGIKEAVIDTPAPIPSTTPPRCSIAWGGSLSFNDYDNNVSRITENVLRRFAADEPLPGPHGAPSSGDGAADAP